MEASNEDWNNVVLALIQALLGVISPNFRMIALERPSDKWLIRFFLERESEGDVEEINEAAGQFDVYMNFEADFEVEIIVSLDFLQWPKPPARVVYKRREEGRVE